MESMGSSGLHRANVGFRDVLRVRTFLILFLAEIQSVVGDQLARVALSVLVFNDTGSAGLTALVYAATYLPAVIGGVAFARLGDLLPRRTAMIACDVARAGLLTLMGLLHLSVGALVAILVLAVLLGPIFTASEVSYLSSALRAEYFRVATGMRLIASQSAQIGGFALGGVVVAGLGAQDALLLDAGTFLISAVAVTVAVPRTLPAAARRLSRGLGSRLARLALWRDHRTRRLVLLCALAGFFVAPEGLAIPFGRSIGATTAQEGVLLAAIPLGSALGAVVTVRFVPAERRDTWVRWMAMIAGLPLVATPFIHVWGAVACVWFVTGLSTAYLVDATTAVVQSAPDSEAARTVGMLNAVLLGAQGVGLIVFGSVASATDPGLAIAVAGVVGSALAVVIALRGRVLRPAPATQ